MWNILVTAHMLWPTRRLSLAAAGCSRYLANVAAATNAAPSTNRLPTLSRCRALSGTAAVKASGTASQGKRR